MKEPGKKTQAAANALFALVGLVGAYAPQFAPYAAMVLPIAAGLFGWAMPQPGSQKAPQ